MAARRDTTTTRCLERNCGYREVDWVPRERDRERGEGQREAGRERDGGRKGEGGRRGRVVCDEP